MKHKHLFVLLLAALVLCLAACSASSSLHGTWVFDYSFVSTNQSFYDVITFNNDDTFLWTLGTTKDISFASYNGTYKCSKDIITLYFSEGPTIDLTYSIYDDMYGEKK